MTDVVTICNLAIGWLGGTLITSLDDGTIEADLCKANFDPARDAVLEDRHWTFATERAVLTPTTEEPVFGRENQFLIPRDTIKLQRVNRTGRYEDNDLDWVREGRFIIAAEERVYVWYTRRIEDTNEFSPNFVQALAQRLAADIAIPLTESRTLQQQHWELYQMKLDDAGATDGMQGRALQTESTRLLRARFGGVATGAGFNIGEPLT